ncbi:SDR family oxidoreductase [Vibrio chagasii]|nr:SDR family oxidoreductase [Vibrio chagasii]CAH7024897.1 SDR family oxidoreductase [Vibrio chagasii]CAH7113993.1 SDR family oxidoreductase [Vibrio chagasii]CAH7163543.1 SDR family oxidoreductase [Vibrio chagasii]CAH7227939.1 SDR family oxidoreductase [Vibrio chagasii]
MSLKNVLVTGASSGIGKDLVVALLKQGHTVYCGARRIENMHDLRILGAHVLEIDVRDEEQVNVAVTKIISEVGNIDIVYSNAGYPIAGPVEETPIEKVHAQFDTNVYGAARLARAVLPHMRERNQGRIIFTTSIAARVSTSMNSWYSASKHALNGMAKGLSQEVADFNIQISTIEPGCVQTELDAIQLQDMKDTNQIAEYKEIVDKSHKFLDEAYRKGATPESTVNHMLKAGFDTKPKLSYQTTLDAKLMTVVQKVIGEKALGSLFSKLIKRTSV